MKKVKAFSNIRTMSEEQIKNLRERKHNLLNELNNDMREKLKLFNVTPKVDKYVGKLESASGKLATLESRFTTGHSVQEPTVIKANEK